ncbi:MAG: PIG-L family deacetylase [Opitutales bacterium]
MSEPKTILAVGAHPDDLEFGCGGILLKSVGGGARVHCVVTSLGESGSAGTPELRKVEAQEAAQMLGHASGPQFLDFGGDGMQIASKENVLKIARIIREVKPTHVLAPTVVKNQHPDHVVVGEAVREACRLARYGGLAVLKDLPVHRVEVLGYYTITSSEERPSGTRMCIDVSEVFDDWQKLMACHQTQVSARGYIELINARARQLGMAAGAEYAQEIYLNDPPLVEGFETIERTLRSF